MPDEEPLFRATNYAMRGEADRAFEWLARCKPGLEFDPALRTLHSDARWHAWLTGNDRSPEQLAAIKFMVKLPP
jgi:hypothetical protein